MRVVTVLSAAILFLLPAAVAPAFAQEHEEGKQPEQKQPQAKPAQRQQQARPERQTQQAQPERQTQQAQHQQQAKPAQQQQQHTARQPQAQPARQQQRGQDPQRASRGTQPAEAHGNIPDAKFRASFGRGHTFHVSRSEFANGSRRFQYGGYWFNAVEPWPTGWLYTDNVYVDYLNGGYFLCNPLHPGVYVSVNIG